MTAPVLSLENISKTFGALIATSGLSLDVRAGEIHALIGPNGAGKTTLIQQIYGALSPDSGSIFLNGDDITSLSVPARVRKGIGRSFQISNVLTGFSVLENAIIAEQARRGHCFSFLSPAFSDASLIAGAEQLLDPAKVGRGRRGVVQAAASEHRGRLVVASRTRLGKALGPVPPGRQLYKKEYRSRS
ncbi:MAG: ATP-binding cassette domain-containing protein, partial [Candidatus Puniceispirillaceae bacterium]